MEPSVVFESVYRSFGRIEAVRGLSLEVEPGRVLGLIGPNGAGKTTSLRLLVGLLKADRGRISILGQDPWNMPREHRLRIGYLSEKDFPFPRMDLRAAAAMTSCFHPTWDQAWLDELVRILEVPTQHEYEDLSRGQQRKFHLALTLASRPEVLLLDDPAQGLDVGVRRQFIRSILPLLQEQKTTVVFSSHIMSDVERIADEVAFLVKGRQVLQRGLDDLKESVREIRYRGKPRPQPRGTLLEQRDQGETSWTVLDPEPSEIAALREEDPTLSVVPKGLEDIYLAVVEADERSVLHQVNQRESSHETS